MSSSKLSELNLIQGDLVMLKGRKGHETICVVLTDPRMNEDKIRMNKVVRKNLRVSLGGNAMSLNIYIFIIKIDFVVVTNGNDAPNLTKIHILPIDDTVAGITENLAITYLIPYFKDAYRPVKKDDTFTIKGASRTIEFKIVACEPQEIGVVYPTTVLYADGEPIKREDENQLADLDKCYVDYDEIGGLEEVKKSLRERCSTNNIQSSKGTLLYGPTGCGKTLLIKALGNECSMLLFLVVCGECFRPDSDGSEPNIKFIFEQAIPLAPCILFFDDLDFVCSSNVSERVVGQFLSEIDNLSSEKNVILIGATCKPEMIREDFLKSVSSPFPISLNLSSFFLFIEFSYTILCGYDKKAI